jgi:2-polyprenyl-6-methoxyphenol hydroxylase-like FAD-dependent oxidoreductase
MPCITSPHRRRAVNTATSPFTPPHGSRLGARAIVLGASIAGLQAARVLGERFDEVWLVERDLLPSGAAPRRGTPQALQPHGLLAKGREVLEELFPGFTATLMAQGALSGDVGERVGFIANGQRLASQPVGHLALAASRLAIEAELRRRVLARPGVRVFAGVDVLAPVFDPARGAVTGVRVARRHDGEPEAEHREEIFNADLVMDCTGRASRSPSWLQRWGYDAPAEHRVPIGLCYISAYFERDAAAEPAQAAQIATATPERPWPAVLIAQEPDASGQARWVLGVGGYRGDHPEPSFAGLQARARQVGSPEMAALAEHGRRSSEIQRYVFAHSQRRHYEDLKRFPARYLVMGDAIASFNPVYGQGMTVAACQALALREALDGGLNKLHRRFFRACARIVETPWQLAVGGDLALPTVPGPRSLSVRCINAYVAKLYRAAVHDAGVAGAFLRVVHMLDRPTALFAPRIVWRVLRGARGPAVSDPGARFWAPRSTPSP